jgi:hypothetical protein
MTWYISAVAIVFAVVYAARAAWIYCRAREVRLLRCPATGTGARVTLDAVRAALTLAPASEHIVRDCSLWPGRAGCAQKCCDDLQLSGSARCLHEILASWFAGKPCSSCYQPIAPFEGRTFTPGLISPAGDLVDWSQVDATTVFNVLDTHQPLCVRCDIVERFRRQRPQLARPEGRPTEEAAQGRARTL